MVSRSGPWLLWLVSAAITTAAIWTLIAWISSAFPGQPPFEPLLAASFAVLGVVGIGLLYWPLLMLLWPGLARRVPGIERTLRGLALGTALLALPGALVVSLAYGRTFPLIAAAAFTAGWLGLFLPRLAVSKLAPGAFIA